MMPANLQPCGEPSSKIHFLVGVDVGSTTVKAVVAAAEDGRILWREYRRHDTRQAGMLREFLLRMESEAGIAPGNCRIFITGSGRPARAAPIGARFVQEVNAVALAVEDEHDLFFRGIVFEQRAVRLDPIRNVGVGKDAAAQQAGERTRMIAR